VVLLGVKLRPVLLINLLAKLIAVGVWALAERPGLAAALFFGPDALVLYHVFMPSAQGLGRVFTRFETARPELWLTIDDGPDPDDTPRILDLLDRHGARATFFPIGERAARHPALVAEILRRGHEVGNHTHTHPVVTFWCAMPRRLGAELDRATAALAMTGARPSRFRAPAGITPLALEAALRARDLPCIGWTIRSGDCFGRWPEKIAAHVARQLRPGAIVLVHEGDSVRPAVRVRAIALILEACTARNYRCIVPERTQLC
jgi:peptidoglycan-N-acetylglucosamine deacetylase